MTNEEAIDTLFYFKMHFAKSDICREHFDMAIKALEQQPCEDCISREQAVYVASGYCAPQNIADELRKLPSVTPQPKRGKWIKANGEENLAIWTCDQCGCKIYSETEHDRKKFHSWCGKCGSRMDADMREVQDGR